MARLRCRPRFFLLVAVVMLSAWAFMHEENRVPEELKHTDLFDAWLQRNRNNISRYEIKKLGLDADSETYQRWLTSQLLDSLREGNVVGEVRDSNILADFKQYQRGLALRNVETGSQDRVLETGGGRVPAEEQVDWQDPLDNDEEDVEYEEDEQEEESIELRLQKRRRTMLSSCAAHEQASAAEDLAKVRSHMYYFFDQKTSVCVMGKAGSSSWREHVHRVLGIPRTADIFEEPRVKEFLGQPDDALFASIASTAKIISVR
ncbi:uncharacterized protein LOC122242777 isoform X2 [Penaeus japonicus]|nr:uncharacterized protein LOC122242777 isoform X2 [Penaeus japonicus]